MATAEEILAGMSEETVEETLEIVIDESLQKMIIPPGLTHLGVAGDDSVKTLHFRCPKMHGKYDLSEFEIFVSYTNEGAAGGILSVSNKVINDSDMTFECELEGDAFLYKGFTAFALNMRLYDEDYIPIKKFNTEPEKLPVKEGMDNGEHFFERYPDIIQRLLDEIANLKENGVGTGGTAREIEMQKSDTAIQWRYVGDEVWTDLLLLSELKGADGKSAYEYAKDGGYTGTEEEFAAKLAKENPTKAEFSQLQQEIADEVTNRENAIAHLKAQGVQQTPIFVNDITECTDQTKVYVLPDGYIYGYMYTKGYGSNIIPIGSAQTKNGLVTTLDGNGGYILNGTATSSAVHKIYEQTNAFPSGFKAGGTYKLTHISGYIGVFAVVYYSNATWTTCLDWTVVTNGSVEFTIPMDAVGLQLKYYPVVGYAYDNEIVRFECSEPFEGYAFTNTGHAFVPTDYEDRILALEKGITGETSTPKPMLTIIDDDGYKKFTTLLLPIIQEKGVPITSAIPASYPNGESNYSSSAMTWEEIETCYLSGAEILPHTYCHLTQTIAETMTQTAIQYDYQKALNAFRNHGIKAETIVYAGGSWGLDKCVNACKNVAAYGIKAGGSVINMKGSVDSHLIARYPIEPDELLNETDLKALIDELVTEGTGWMVWMIHTSDSGFQQTQADIISTVIDYAIEQGIDIVTTECGARHYI